MHNCNNNTHSAYTNSSDVTYINCTKVHLHRQSCSKQKRFGEYRSILSHRLLIRKNMLNDEENPRQSEVHYANPLEPDFGPVERPDTPLWLAILLKNMWLLVSGWISLLKRDDLLVVIKKIKNKAKPDVWEKREEKRGKMELRVCRGFYLLRWLLIIL